jgi:hypothetical protein
MRGRQRWLGGNTGSWDGNSCRRLGWERKRFATASHVAGFIAFTQVSTRGATS